MVKKTTIALLWCVLLGCTPERERLDNAIHQVEASKRQVIAERYRRQAELQAQILESPRELAGEIQKTAQQVERELRPIESQQLSDLNTRLSQLRAQRASLR